MENIIEYGTGSRTNSAIAAKSESGEKQPKFEIFHWLRVGIATCLSLSTSNLTSCFKNKKVDFKKLTLRRLCSSASPSTNYDYTKNPPTALRPLLTKRHLALRQYGPWRMADG